MQVLDIIQYKNYNQGVGRKILHFFVIVNSITEHIVISVCVCISFQKYEYVWNLEELDVL